MSRHQAADEEHQEMRGHGLSKKVMSLFLDTPDVGPLDDAHGEGWGGSLESGRFIRIQVRLDSQQRVEEARFGTYGCAPAIASAAWVTQWSRGRSGEDVEQLTASDVLKGLGGLPSHRRYCAFLAVEALQVAMKQAVRAVVGGETS